MIIHYRQGENGDYQWEWDASVTWDPSSDSEDNQKQPDLRIFEAKIPFN